MANPSATSDADGEYFEVYNTGAPIDVSTLTIKDNGSDSIDLSGETGTIETNQFFVFGSRALSYADLNWDNAEPYFLANSGDEIIVE